MIQTGIIAAIIACSDRHNPPLAAAFSIARSLSLVLFSLLQKLFTEIVKVVEVIKTNCVSAVLDIIFLLSEMKTCICDRVAPFLSDTSESRIVAQTVTGGTE